MTSLARDSWNQPVKLQPSTGNGSSTVARKAILGLIAADVAAECLVKARRRIQTIPDSPIQTIDAAVIADAAFIEFPVMSQNIGLSDSSISKDVRNWLTYTSITI